MSALLRPVLHPFARAASALLCLALLAVPAAAETVIRFGHPGVGAEQRPYSYGDATTYARARQLIEKEFADDKDVKIEWTFFRGAGPALNESVASGQLDFFLLGDLPAIVGRARGLKHKFIFATGRNNPIFLAVPTDSTITKVEDVKGKKVALFKGTNLQNATDRILALHGLSEKDVRFINLDANAAVAALTSGNVDAVFGGQEYLPLAAKGVVKIVYTTKGDDPTLGRNSSYFVTEAFAAAHPDLTQRVVTAFIKAAHFISQDQNRDEAFEAWALSGLPKETFVTNFDGVRLSLIVNPLIDDYVVARYKEQAQAAKDYGLLKGDPDIDHWFDRTYLNAALKTMKLEDFWSTRDGRGNIETRGSIDQKASN
ncbi:sulfonate transport system substrate-binding protein [Xanthobacter flavus]|uniref:Sulfate ester-binding protein n=1 Tax=Xanthobacter flavus TaxID=281 RepID=A0A9W6CQX1_XANFL|nr:ABC transporter substrate-binding protein [Xanthobacter flavus]MDR6336430.1 sulfonate transport system substrate-binding protein [Xanthobacter flavus]GLI25219.1 sulfate ester-binding protein [Xanthobacter flavus]